MRRKEYKTKRLILRPFKLSDFRVWKKSHESIRPKIDKFDIEPWPVEKRTKEEFRQLVSRQKGNAEKDSLYVWNIFLAKTGEFIGRVDVATIIRQPYEMANLGYYILNPYRGVGYAAEAVKRITQVGLSDLKFHRLEAAIDTDNKASIQLVKKIGLHREGIKKHYWFQNNRWEDQVVFIATPELFK